MILVEVCLANIITTMMAGPIVTLGLVREMSVGTHTSSRGPGECPRHFWPIVSLSVG